MSEALDRLMRWTELRDFVAPRLQQAITLLSGSLSKGHKRKSGHMSQSVVPNRSRAIA